VVQDITAAQVPPVVQVAEREQQAAAFTVVVPIRAIADRERQQVLLARAELIAGARQVLQVPEQAEEQDRAMAPAAAVADISAAVVPAIMAAAAAVLLIPTRLLQV
jgi:hypothetical protein